MEDWIVCMQNLLNLLTFRKNRIINVNIFDLQFTQNASLLLWLLFYFIFWEFSLHTWHILLKSLRHMQRLKICTRFKIFRGNFIFFVQLNFFLFLARRLIKNIFLTTWEILCCLLKSIVQFKCLLYPPCSLITILFEIKWKGL